MKLNAVIDPSSTTANAPIDSACARFAGKSPAIRPAIIRSGSEVIAPFHAALDAGKKGHVRWTADLVPILSGRLEPELAAMLPRKISLIVESSVTQKQEAAFVRDMGAHLRGELERRRARGERFVELGALSKNEVTSLLTAKQAHQPWVLYFNREGAPRVGDRAAKSGYVPCTSMRNHGVAWVRSNTGVRVWLATAPKPGGEWDLQTDIGHESAHAAFAPVPLFVGGESAMGLNVTLDEVEGAAQMTPDHFARITYQMMETMVLVIRGEERDTKTKLAIPEWRELVAMVTLLEELVPGVGFDRAIEAAKRASQRGELGDDAFFIAAPMIRIAHRLSTLAGADRPPDRAWFEAIRS
jgi:hypothetical protein